MRKLCSISRILGWNTLIVIGLALSSTWICTRFGFTADFPMTRIGIAVVFPLVFWIDEAAPAWSGRIRDLLGDLLRRAADLFGTPVSSDTGERAVYARFSDLSRELGGIRRHGLGAGPTTLRAYATIFIYLVPVLYGPYFAELVASSGTPFAYVMPVLLALILVSLDNIQGHLENPFDQIGEDDVKLRADKFVAALQAHEIEERG